MGPRLLTCLVAILATSCDKDFPRDPNGTLENIQAARQFDVGVAAPLMEGQQAERIQALLDRTAEAAGATPRVETGDTEPLLKRLEEGELDLVIARFDKRSPWAKLVAIGPPIHVEHQGDTVLELAPAMQNGENAWIALVEREARDLAPEAQ